MPTEAEITQIVQDTKILWDETPQSFLSSWQTEIRTQEDYERYMRILNEAVGTGYFYVDCRGMSAELVLMHSTSPGYWETMIIPTHLSPLLEEDLVRSIEADGGALNWSGHYSLDSLSLAKVRASYFGDGDTSFFTAECVRKPAYRPYPLEACERPGGIIRS